ncbi:MAG: 1-deoxy-D-xylulose-5-phosphate synthase [Candidatus Nanopelagicales bacterium]|nr:1-deoxy-D-xylulose-5-phosphate synthase [Candidatus Nanopelagicales bacterium]
MTILDSIHDPRDVRALSPEKLPQLASEIREFLVEKVSATGGHLGPNLGVVELTIALHRIFRSPSDMIIWDTGHQAYVHKILTGRAADFDSLRQEGGLSGYPSRQESVHDLVENSHASTALSYADGLAKAWEQRGILGEQHVVAVIGDGALTGGMAWEALNNIAASDRPVVIVVNDNARSYSPTIGGLAHHLASLRTAPQYERVMGWGKRVLHRTPVVGQPIYEALHGMKKGVKDVVAPQGMFEDLGLKYIGPIDGHNESELEFALALARDFNGPVIVHAMTHKGHGYGPAERDEADRFHGVGVIDPETGIPLKVSGPTWTQSFSDELVEIGRARPHVVAITAAMLGPTGLDRFAQEFPDRIFDVGIAEQHAATHAAGLAYGGMHPVVAVYATFLNRAFDQVLMDCALHKAGVTFILDRAGVTGDDGASHNGVWDMSMLQIVPGLHIAAPRDGATLRRALRESIEISDAPSVIRFSKGSIPEPIHAIAEDHGVDILAMHGSAEVCIVAIGSFAGLGLEIAEGLRAQGIGTQVIDPRWVKPLPAAVIQRAQASRLVIVLEDGIRVGGVGAAISQALRDSESDIPVRNFGTPLEFLDHAQRGAILQRLGLTAQEITRYITEWMSQRGMSISDDSERHSPSDYLSS